MPADRMNVRALREGKPYGKQMINKGGGQIKKTPGGLLGRLHECNYDLLERTLFQMNIRDLKYISDAHPELDNLIKSHVQGSVYRMFTGLGFDPSHALQVLAESGSVISGSAALLVLNPYTFIPQDLDIYCPRSQLNTVVVSLLERYPRLRKKVPPPGYGDIPHVYTTVSMTDGRRAVNIVASRSENNLLPIFSFHSSAVMNYISPSEIYCGYPDLTFEYRNIINLLAACTPGANSAKFAGCIAKYDERGYAYCADPTEWPGYQDNYFVQPSTERGLRDKGHFSFRWKDDGVLGDRMEEVWSESSWKLARARITFT